MSGSPFKTGRFWRYVFPPWEQIVGKSSDNRNNNKLRPTSEKNLYLYIPPTIKWTFLNMFFACRNALAWPL